MFQMSPKIHIFLGKIPSMSSISSLAWETRPKARLLQKFQIWIARIPVEMTRGDLGGWCKIGKIVYIYMYIYIYVYIYICYIYMYIYIYVYIYTLYLHIYYIYIYTIWLFNIAMENHHS